MNRIKGKVAAFVGSREIAINVGRKDGVQPGMLFDVLSSVDGEVKDPDTGEVIGLLDRKIARVQAIDVQDHVTVCATYVPTGPDSLADALEALLVPRPTPHRPRAGSPWGTSVPLNPTHQYVRIGDHVRQVTEP